MASKPKKTTTAEAPATAPGPKRTRVGAHTKRTPETRKALLEAIELGLSDKSSCNYACCSQDFFYEWMKHDIEFSEDVQRARGRFVALHQATIRKAAQEDWKASAWLLARRQPEEYAERQTVEVAGARCPLDKLFEPVANEERPDDSPDA